MAPWFARMEQRLNIHKWEMAPNTNNNILRVGCEKLGFHWEIIPRNVNGCWNLGYCGMGCPTNAKQSMLITYLPDAVAATCAASGSDDLTLLGYCLGGTLLSIIRCCSVRTSCLNTLCPIFLHPVVGPFEVADHEAVIGGELRGARRDGPPE